MNCALVVKKGILLFLTSAIYSAFSVRYLGPRSFRILAPINIGILRGALLRTFGQVRGVRLIQFLSPPLPPSLFLPLFILPDPLRMTRCCRGQVLGQGRKISGQIGHQMAIRCLILINYPIRYRHSRKSCNQEQISIITSRPIM